MMEDSRETQLAKLKRIASALLHSSPKHEGSKEKTTQNRSKSNTKSKRSGKQGKTPKSNSRVASVEDLHQGLALHLSSVESLENPFGAKYSEIVSAVMY